MGRATDGSRFIIITVEKQIAAVLMELKLPLQQNLWRLNRKKPSSEIVGRPQNIPAVLLLILPKFGSAGESAARRSTKWHLIYFVDER